MARPKKVNKSLIYIASIIALIVGVAVGMTGCVYFSNPAGFTIPGKLDGSSSNTEMGAIDVDVVKEKDLSIHFLELGNKYTGDCTFIKVGETEILIDAGSRASSVSTISAYIDEYIEGALDYVIVTHAHQDHYAGFATNYNEQSLFDIYAEVGIGTVIEFAKSNQKEDSKLFKNYQQEKKELLANSILNGTDTKIVTALDCVKERNGASRVYNLSADVRLEILYHKYYEQDAESENDYSVCCQIVQGTGENAKYYLFTGDLEADGELSLIDGETQKHGKNEGMLHPVELYKAGHHGSKTSSSAAFLNVFQPKHVCVCCCAGSSEYTKTNANQFPTQQFVDRISLWTEKVFVTSLCVNYSENNFTSMNGNIVVCSNTGENTSVYCSNNTTLLKDTDWFKANREMPVDWAVTS